MKNSMKMPCKLFLVMFFLMTFWNAETIMAEDYVKCYQNAFEEVETERLNYCHDLNYNGHGYTLCDLTGDGIKEIIFVQISSKHAAHYWVYTTDGATSIYMGEFDADNGIALGGYKEGIIYEQHYKGWNSVTALIWDGSSFEETELYSGTYDKENDPPSVEELYGYFDSSRIIEWAADFVNTADKSLLEELSGVSLSWKSEYQHHIENMRQSMLLAWEENKNPKFALVFIDGDNIPELISYSSVWADSTFLFTWQNEQFKSYEFGTINSYIPYTGYFLEADGHMGEGWDKIYAFIEGECYLLGNGEYSFMGEEKYIWDDENVSSEKYQSNKDELYNESDAIAINALYTYPEILSVIDDF